MSNLDEQGSLDDRPNPATPRRSIEMQPQRSRGEKPGEKKRKVTAAIKEVAIVVIGALVISFALRTFVVQTFEIPSESMQQTLEKGDRILVSKVIGYHRGDIVVFEDPGHWIERQPPDPPQWRKGLELIGVFPDSSRNHVVKRIIGTEGDRVKCCDAQGRIAVNGTPLEESEYLYRESSGLVKPSDYQFEVVVPQGRLFMMGDHRNFSSDSRCHFVLGIDTFVPQSKVVGPVVAIGTPFDRMRRFVTPQTFTKVPKPSAPAPEKPEMNPPDLRC